MVCWWVTGEDSWFCRRCFLAELHFQEATPTSSRTPAPAAAATITILGSPFFSSACLGLITSSPAAVTITAFPNVSILAKTGTVPVHGHLSGVGRHLELQKQTQLTRCKMTKHRYTIWNDLPVRSIVKHTSSSDNVRLERFEHCCCCIGVFGLGLDFLSSRFTVTLNCYNNRETSSKSAKVCCTIGV